MSKTKGKNSKTITPGERDENGKCKVPHTYYGLLGNMVFVAKKIWQYRPVLVPMFACGAVVSSVMNYLWGYIGKFLIDIIQAQAGMASKDIRLLVWLTAGIAAAELLAVGGNTIIRNRIGYRVYYVFFCMVTEKNDKLLPMNYQVYRLFAPVFQNVELFAFPMSENMSMDKSELTDRERAKQCLIKAGLGEKLRSLPKGIDTEILKILHEDGIDLSGGEKQKLALARALYKDAPVIVLDEPTAALDPVAEYEIYRQFEELVEGKTAIYISHRLSSCQFCDRIAVFADGAVAEYGTHAELAAVDGGLYAGMFMAQAQYYVGAEKYS